MLPIGAASPVVLLARSATGRMCRCSPAARLTLWCRALGTVNDEPRPASKPHAMGLTDLVTHAEETIGRFEFWPGEVPPSSSPRSGSQPGGEVIVRLLSVD